MLLKVTRGIVLALGGRVHESFLCPASGLVQFIGPWLSLVERLVRDEEVASSNLAGPKSFFFI